MVREGHQVMVFVHARKETVKSAQRLLEMAKEEGMTSYFDTREHPKNAFYRRDISTSQNKEMRELFDAGFGIHHAGMLRSDRNMMERMFEDNAIKVGKGSSRQRGTLIDPGPVLHFDACLGCQFTGTCGRHQRHPGI